MISSSPLKFYFLSLFSLVACNVLSQNNLPPLEPASKHYKTLAKLNSGPDKAREALDTIQFSWTDYINGTPISQVPLKYLSRQDSTLLHQQAHFPANSSLQTKAEIEYLLTIQKTRTKADIDTSLVLAKIAPYPIFFWDKKDSLYYQTAKSLFFIAHTLGDSLNIDNFPAIGKLVSNCMQDVKLAEYFLKVGFKRSRPYQLESKLQPIMQIPTPAFPSGHTLWAYAEAYLFGEIIPEKRSDFLKLADQVRWSREILGIHFPSDNEAARVFSWYLLKYWYNNPGFVKDLAKAKAEWESKKDMLK